VKTNFSDEK